MMQDTPEPQYFATSYTDSYVVDFTSPAPDNENESSTVTTKQVTLENQNAYQALVNMTNHRFGTKSTTTDAWRFWWRNCHFFFSSSLCCVITNVVVLGCILYTLHLNVSFRGYDFVTRTPDKGSYLGTEIHPETTPVQPPHTVNTVEREQAKSNHPIKEQWKHYDRGKGDYSRHFGTEYNTKTLEGSLFAMFVKELSSPLNGYLRELSLNLTTPLLQKLNAVQTNREEISVHIDLVDTILLNVKERMELSFSLKKKSSVEAGLFGATYSVPFQDKLSQLKDTFHATMVKSLVEKLVWVFIRSPSYRCCCRSYERDGGINCGTKRSGSLIFESSELNILPTFEKELTTPYCQLFSIPILSPNDDTQLYTLNIEDYNSKTYLDFFTVYTEFKFSKNFFKETECSLQMILDEDLDLLLDG